MALTNFELYEQLRKELSEESAKMMAEAFPQASDLTTKDDFASLKDDFAALRVDFTSLVSAFNTLRADVEVRFAQAELRQEQRFAEFERRVFRWGLTLALPIWATVVAGLVKVVIKL